MAGTGSAGGKNDTSPCRIPLRNVGLRIWLGAGARSAYEPGADWTKKKGKAFFGYKVHIGVDAGSGLIRRVVLTSAKIWESTVAEQLICGDEAAVYGDRAYEHKARRRAPVEAVFSALKHLYGLRRAKSRSLERNTARLYVTAAAYNLRRACLIAGA